MEAEGKGEGKREDEDEDECQQQQSEADFLAMFVSVCFYFDVAIIASIHVSRVRRCSVYRSESLPSILLP